MWRRHWEEIALNQDTIPLDPDWPRYFQLELCGALACWTARSEGKLVGYIMWIVTPSLHYASTLYAMSDIFWLDPAYRSGWVGIKLFKTCLPSLKQSGVKAVQIRVRDTFQTGADGRGRVGKFLERIMRFRQIDTNYEMVF